MNLRLGAHMNAIKTVVDYFRRCGLQQHIIGIESKSVAVFVTGCVFCNRAVVQDHRKRVIDAVEIASVSGVVKLDSAGGKRRRSNGSSSSCWNIHPADNIVKARGEDEVIDSTMRIESIIVVNSSE